MLQVLIVIFLIAFLILSFKAPKLMAWIVTVGGFLGIVAVNLYIDGFPKGLILGLPMGGGFALLAWIRFQKNFADTEKARIWLRAMSIHLKRSYNCKRCGAKLPYQRTPRNFRQLMWGGWTCSNCGAELDSSGNELES